MALRSKRFPVILCGCKEDGKNGIEKLSKSVIRDLERYLEILMQTGSIETAYRRLWEEKHVPVGLGGMPRYQDLLPGVATSA